MITQSCSSDGQCPGLSSGPGKCVTRTNPRCGVRSESDLSRKLSSKYFPEVLNGRGANCRLQAGRCIQCRNNRDCSRGVCRARLCI